MPIDFQFWRPVCLLFDGQQIRRATRFKRLRSAGTKVYAGWPNCPDAGDTHGLISRDPLLEIGKMTIY